MQRVDATKFHRVVTGPTEAERPGLGAYLVYCACCTAALLMFFVITGFRG